MKQRHVAQIFGILCALLATSAAVLWAIGVAAAWSPRGVWRLEIGKNSLASCGPYGSHLSPEQLHISFGPLDLWFPPTREAIAAVAQNNAATAARAAAAKARKHYEVGQRTPDGKLIVYVFKETCADIPEILKTDFGIMLDHSASPGQMIYTLAEQRTGRIQYFFTLADAKKAIRALPRQATFAHYDKCTTPMAYGFTDHTEQLLSIARRHRLKVLPDHVRVCTCEGMEGCK